MATTKQSGKPYPDYPLTMHSSGQWKKKIRGRVRYFGTDADAALESYLEQRDALLAGRTPKSMDGLTVRELCNRFLASKRLLVDTGELSSRTWLDYHVTALFIANALGKERAVEDLAGEDFEKLRSKLAKTRGPVALGNSVQRIRSIFRYAFDESLIDKPIKFGSSFKRPSKKTMRAARHVSGARMLEAKDIRELIDTAESPLKAMILLGINAAFGQSDVACLPISALDLKGGWVTFPRPKTAMERRCKLWPETIAALKVAIKKRPVPKSPDDAGLAFITKYGYRWVRRIERQTDKGIKVMPLDAIVQAFKKVMAEAKIVRPGLGFYSLRHSHRTVSDAAKDQRASDYIMGHASPHISATYVERIGDDRLEAITNEVRKWLWPKKK